MFLETYPEGEGNYCVWLPLHDALQLKASDNIVEMIYWGYPNAAELKCNDWSLPLYVTLRYRAIYNVNRMMFEENKSKEGNLPFCEEIASMTDNSTLKLILKHKQRLHHVKSRSWKLPLHKSSNSATAKVELLDLFVTVYRWSIGVKNRVWWLVVTIWSNLIKKILLMKTCWLKQ